MREFLAVARLELARTLFHRRALPLYLLAVLPVGIALLAAIFNSSESIFESLGEMKGFFAYYYQYFLQRHILFFGCVWLFMNVFRGEMVDRTLHFWLLAPIRRDVLAAGKFVGAFGAACLLFVGSTLATFLVFHLPFGASAVFSSELAAYLGVSTLACIGYGAVFLLLGILFRNPAVAAVALYGWEWLHIFLPAALKKLSVVHYLKALAPVPMAEGPLAILGDPVSPFFAVGGLLVFSAALLAISAALVRRLEIQYAVD